MTTCFLGDVVHWTPGDDYALVRPCMQFENGFVRKLSPLELEVEFLATGAAIWMRPGPRCQVGRWVIFRKGAAATLNREKRRYQIEPIMPRVAIRNGNLTEEMAPLGRILDYLSVQLSARGAHHLAQNFKVYLKRDEDYLDYFGPFEQKGASFQPPAHPGTVKRYAGLPTIQLEELDIDILPPLLELKKIQEIRDIYGTTPETEAPPPSLSFPSEQAIHLHLTAASLKGDIPTATPALTNPLVKPDQAPTQGLNAELKTPELAQTTSLTGEELNRFQDAILDGSALGLPFQSLLPLLHEHGDFALYFAKELEAHKRHLDQRMEEAFETIIQGERELEVGRQALAQDRRALEDLREHLVVSAPQVVPETEKVVEARRLPSPDFEVNRPSGAGLSPAPVLPIEGEPKNLSYIQGVLREHIPLARLQVAWSVGRIPLLCGPRSLILARKHADLVCGGRLRWVSIDPLLVRARDLIGTFVDGWFRPHPSGLASLILQGQSAKHPSQVVFEGANRVPLELLLEPLLHSREAGLPLFAAEAFRQEDPWAPLGQLSWPTTLLIACTLTVGSAKQPISPVLWDRLMVVDEEGWPRQEPTLERSYLASSDFSKLIVPIKNQTGKDALQEFQDELKEAGWAAPRAMEVIQCLEALEVPDPQEETLTLLLAAGALCAGVDLKAMETTFQGGAMRRVERLHPYLA